MISNPRKQNEFYYNGLTPLHIATKNGFIDIVKYMLENGADPIIETMFLSLKTMSLFIIMD